MSVLRAIWYSFLYETSRRLIFLLSVWCGVLVADIYFNRMLGIGFISFIAMLFGIAVGLVYILSFFLLKKIAGNARIKWFNFNGHNYYVCDDTSSISDPAGAGLFYTLIYSLFSIPIYIFKIALRIFLSIVSKTYRQSIEEYYYNESYEMFDKLKWGAIFMGAYAVIIAIMFGLLALEGVIYSPKKIEIENARITYFSNSLGDGYCLDFDYYSTSDKVVALYAPSGQDKTVLYIEDTMGNIVYELKHKTIILDTSSWQTTESIYLGGDFSMKYWQDGYKMYLVFDQLEAKSLLSTSRKNINYAMRVL